MMSRALAPTERSGTIAGAVAGAAWVLLCARWFDGPHRGAALLAIPALVPAAVLLVSMLAWIAARRLPLRAMVATAAPGKLALAVGLAFAFRLPLAWHGAAGYVTSDGALSGIVALRIRDGLEHLVFVPHVPYSGSLKSHLAAAGGLVMDLPRAFALASVLFYCLFVAAAFLLAERAWRRTDLALAAAVYLAFAPAFVTRYSLSNDGNYVEVLALGSAALLAVVAWDEDRARLTLPLVAGILLGLAFWCHILAVIHVAAAGLFVLGARRAAGPAVWRLGVGGALGYAPGLLWNAANGGESFHYLLPGGAPVEAAVAMPLSSKLWALLSDHAIVLTGYDPGYAPVADGLLRAAAILALIAAGWAAVRGRSAIAGAPALRAVLLLALVDVAMAAIALPYIPGNPRYLLFSILTVAVLLSRITLERGGRPLLAALVLAGALGSWAQAPATLRADAQWRRFAADLESAGVRWCYSDFYLATKINFLSGERVVCSAKLGPTTTEYFFDYRAAVDAAPEAALVAVNGTAAEKLERRLDRLGVAHERRDLMKPVLLGLSRKVDVGELFPGREFPLR